MKFTGKNGVLRIFDGSKNLHGAAPRDDATVDIVIFDGGVTWANITTNVEADDGFTSPEAFLLDNDSFVFVGSDVPFSIVKYSKDIGTYGVGTGALKAFYFDGTDFTEVLTGVVDGTASGGDCFAADGHISFKAPAGWAVGANAYTANLDADKYYIALQTTTSPSTDPDADVLCPVDGQYFEISFAAMDFSGPLGRGKSEEMLVLDRGNINSKAHYIEGVDGKIYESLPVSFSALLDDLHNRYRLQAILAGEYNLTHVDSDDQGGNAYGVWGDGNFVYLANGAVGLHTYLGPYVTTKGQTKNDATNLNPSFADITKRTVNIHFLMESARTAGLDQGMAFYETYFPPDEITIAEAEDGITISAAGGCFGIIERISHLCNRY